MPEGDTIWRAARTLHAALAGRTRHALRVAAARGGGGAPAASASWAAPVAAVEARGKHLLVRFDGGPSLHTHMG